MKNQPANNWLSIYKFAPKYLEFLGTMSNKFRACALWVCIYDILLYARVFWWVVATRYKQNQVKISAISFQSSTFTLTISLTLEVTNKTQYVRACVCV